jgi:hypothetical protein
MDQTIPPKPSSGSGMTMYFVMFIMFIIIVVLAICVYQFIAKPIMDDQAKKEKENKDAETAIRLADEASANKYSYLPNMDRNADNLAGGVPGSLKSCRQSCDNTTGCVAFSVTKDYSECFLKSAVMNPGPANRLDYYYTKPLVNKTYTKTADKDAQGSKLGPWITGGADECKKACDITSGCVGFIAKKDDKLCLLKSNVSNQVASADWDTFSAPA